MDQYLLIPFLGGWTSIYQLFWCLPGVQGFDTLEIVCNCFGGEKHIETPCLWPASQQASNLTSLLCDISPCSSVKVQLGWPAQHYTNVVADPALGQFCIGCCEKLLVGCQAASAIMILDFGSSWWFSPPICPSNDDGADYVTPNWRICILVLICQFWQQSAVLFYGDCKMYPNFRAPLCTCTSFPDSVNTWILYGLLPFLSDPSLLLQVCFQNGLHCVLWWEYNPNQLPMLPWPIGWPLIQSAHRCAWYLQHVYIFPSGKLT